MSTPRAAAVLRIATTFLVKDPKTALKGETVRAKDLPKLEAALKKLQQEYKAGKVALEKVKQGQSGKAKGLAGNKLRKIGEEGRKARTRLDIAKMLKKQGFDEIEYKGGKPIVRIKGKPTDETLSEVA